MVRKYIVGLVVLATSFGYAEHARAQLEGLFGKIKGTAEATKKIAYFKLDGELIETPTQVPPLFGGEKPLSLHELLTRLRAARVDPNVTAVVVDLQYGQFGLGQMEELNASLRKFAAVDKPVYVHAETLTTVTYAAATGATQISMVPTGDVWLMGLMTEAPYIRGMLDKINCVPDFEHCGDYKTAAETLTRTGPSKEAEQMTNWLLDSLFDTVVRTIGTGRNLSPERVRELINNGPYSSEDALTAGLVDAVQHRQEFVKSLRDRYGESVEFDSDYGDSAAGELPQDPFAMLNFLMEMLNPAPKSYTKPTVAIIYVDGMIQSGSAEVSPFGSSSGAYSTTLRKALSKAADEDQIKAVVLRVDSPGGSALASEIILDAGMRLKAKGKPMIISMGNVAGSGGYYVSCHGDTIFADASTLTASIGVVGGKLVTTGGWEKLGITWHSTKRGEMAGMLSTGSAFSDKERAKFKGYMDSVYGVFKQHVVTGRGKRLHKPIDEIAGGRVFTGAQALEIGLVDRLGGLDDAVKFAADNVGISDYDVRVVPEPMNILELLMHAGEEDKVAHVQLSPSRGAADLFEQLRPALSTLDAPRVNAIQRLIRRLELVHREGAAFVMPMEFVVR